MAFVVRVTCTKAASAALAPGSSRSKMAGDTEDGTLGWRCCCRVCRTSRLRRRSGRGRREGEGEGEGEGGSGGGDAGGGRRCTACAGPSIWSPPPRQRRAPSDAGEGAVALPCRSGVEDLGSVASVEPEGGRSGGRALGGGGHPRR